MNEIAQEKKKNLRDVSSSDGLSSGRVRTDNVTDLPVRSFQNLFTKFEESSGRGSQKAVAEMGRVES